MSPERIRSPWQRHRRRWEDCELCELASGRKRVVLARGKLPCDLLFIGEAPGVSENLLGKPFVGPAGKLLDSMIEEAVPPVTRIAFTNLVACFPQDAKETNDHRPPEKAIKACNIRLRDLIRVSQPAVLILVGKLAAKWVPIILEENLNKFQAHISILHPAAILRTDIGQRGFLIQQQTATIAWASNQLIPF